MFRDDVLLRPVLQLAEALARRLRTPDATTLDELNTALAAGTGLSLEAARRMSDATLVAIYNPTDSLGAARLRAVLVALEAEGRPEGVAKAGRIRARMGEATPAGLSAP